MEAQKCRYVDISRETGLSINIIRNRLGKTRNPIATNRPRGNKSKILISSSQDAQPILPQSKSRPGKYNHILNEKRCQGKMYEEYLKSVDKVTKAYASLI